MKMFLKLKKIVPKRNYSSLITEELGLDQVYPVKMSTFNEKSFPSTYYTTNLPNGIKGYLGSGASVVSIVVDAGSRFECYKTNGSSHFAQRFFFDHTNTRTKLRLVAEMQKTGSTVYSSNGREEMVYTMETLSPSVPKLFELFTDSILHTRLHEHDFEPKHDLVERDLNDYSGVPEVVVNENLHRIAFGEKTLGRSVLCPPHNLDKLSREDIIHFFEKLYTPERITVLGTNVEQSELVKLAQELMVFPQESYPKLEKETATYYGGELRLHENFEHGSETYSTFAFKGVSSSSSSMATYNVLAHLLGDFNNLTSDPTTKGKSSVLYRSFGKSLDSAKAFSLNYSDAGLFGVLFTGSSDKVGDSLKQLVSILQMAKENISDQDFQRAQNQTLLSVASNFESNVTSHEFFMKFENKGNILNDVKSVSKKDVQKAIQEILSSKPTLVSYGDLSKVPFLSDLKF